MTRWWPSLSFVVAVLAAGCGEGSAPSPAAAPKPIETRVDNSAEVPIEVVTPQARMRRGILETSGKVQFNEETVTRVHSPVTGGVVVERNIVPGQVVAYGQSDTPVNLFVIADLSTMWVFADVYEPDIPRVQRDQPVTVTLPCCPGERFEGRVSYISDIVDKDTRTIKVRAVVPNRGRLLKAEMFVKVAIATGATRVLALQIGRAHV